MAAERLLDQRGIANLVVDQEQARRLALGIELADESVVNLFNRDVAGMGGDIAAIADTLAGAEDEELDADQTAFRMHGDDVGILDLRKVDVLLLGDMRQRPDAVAQRGGGLEVERFGGSLDPLAPGVENVTVAAAEEVARLVHQRQIVGLRDALNAGRRAALDLVLQAG